MVGHSNLGRDDPEDQIYCSVPKLINLGDNYVAPVARIEPHGDNGKYKLIFSEPARAIGPVPLGDPFGAPWHQAQTLDDFDYR
jgi:hypothetical protein